MASSGWLIQIKEHKQQGHGRDPAAGPDFRPPALVSLSGHS
jgi:hypothetical protein